VLAALFRLIFEEADNTDLFEPTYRRPLSGLTTFEIKWIKISPDKLAKRLKFDRD